MVAEGRNTIKTQVAIVGAGPAGLLLGHLLLKNGIQSVIVERRSRDYVESRIRAGVLEDTTANILRSLDIDDRLRREGLPHSGIKLADGERLVHIDIESLTGRQVMVYGQTEVTRELIDAASSRGLEIIWEAGNVALHGVDSDTPSVTFEQDGASRRIDARFFRRMRRFSRTVASRGSVRCWHGL